MADPRPLTTDWVDRDPRREHSEEHNRLSSLVNGALVVDPSLDAALTAAAARTTLGLGTAATTAASAYDPAGTAAAAVSAIPSGGAAGTPSLRALGTGATTAAAGNDSRVVRAAVAMTAAALPGASGTITLDCSVATVWYGTVSGDVTLNLTSLPPAGTLVEIQVKLTQDGSGGHVITAWQVAGSPVVPSWDTGTAPTVNGTAGASTIVNVQTVNAGASLEGQGAQPANVSSLTAGANVAVTGGDGSGHGALTVAAPNVAPLTDPRFYGTFGPQDMGTMKALSADPRFAGSSRAMVAGVLYCCKLKGVPGGVSTTLRYFVSTASSGAGSLANVFFACFNQAGTQLSVTSNQAGASPFTSGDHGLTIPSTTVPADGVVVVSILAGTLQATVPQLASGGGAVNGLTWGQDGSTGYPYFAYGSGLSAVPSSLTLNSTNCTIAAPGQSAVLLALT